MKLLKSLMLASATSALCLGGQAATAQDMKVEVMHNMASPTQQEALNVLIRAFEKAGGSWTDLAIAGGSKARQAMVNRAVAGDPSEVMYVHAKLVFGELTEAGLTTAVAPAGWEDWEKNVPASLWSEMVDDQGRVVITPLIIGLHNVAYFNKKAMADAGVEAVPQTYDELFPALDKLQAAGGDVIPLVVSETPIQMFQTLHNITAGVAGSAIYNRIYVDHDPTAFDEPKFREVAETLRKLKPYTDAGRSSRVWQDAAVLVATDKAGAMIYGTFALEGVLGAGAVSGETFECSNLGGVAIIGPNGFMYGRPDNEAEQNAQNLFASVIMDPAVQAEFVRVGGGIPSRTDADMSSLDKCMVDVSAALSDPAMNVKDPSMTMPPTMSGAVQDAVVDFWANDDVTVDAFIEKLKSAMAVR